MSRVGSLAALLRAHDERGLGLFLLHHAVASVEPWDFTRDARVWARALGLHRDRDRDARVAAVSKTCCRLDEGHSLIQRERRGRLAKITALREDALGKSRTYPNGSKRDERQLKLPYDYWTGTALVPNPDVPCQSHAARVAESSRRVRPPHPALRSRREVG